MNRISPAEKMYRFDTFIKNKKKTTTTKTTMASTSLCMGEISFLGLYPQEVDIIALKQYSLVQSGLYNPIILSQHPG